MMSNIITNNMYTEDSNAKYEIFGMYVLSWNKLTKFRTNPIKLSAFHRK